MGATTESPRSPVGGLPAEIIDAARAVDGDFGRLETRLAPLRSEEAQQLFSATATLAGGLRALVDLRAYLMAHRADGRDLQPVEEDVRATLVAEFEPKRLTFETIGVDASEEQLALLVDYESVHEIRSRADLMRRLHPQDRRCFALVHPSLGDEPVVFVEVALGSGLADSVQAILDPDAPVADPDRADTATFYSINNCHPGLKGIPFGAELLRRAMAYLIETTAVTVFSTLSPIPGFARWLGAEVPDDDRALLAACARYLLTARRNGGPLDPVARFHLRSGARVERLNPRGDISERGRRRYQGVTVNYVYDGERLAENQAAYRRGEIVASADVRSLLATP